MNNYFKRMVCHPMLNKIEFFPQALLQLFGIKFVITGDRISPDEWAILMMNHRTRVDYLFVSAAMYYSCLPRVLAHRLKIVFKDFVRHVVAIGNRQFFHATILTIETTQRLTAAGWQMQLAGYLAITRNWKEDKGRISDYLDYLIEINRRTQILLFPEGTNKDPDTTLGSDKYARANNLPKYKHVLHPRTTGFTYMTQHLQVN